MARASTVRAIRRLSLANYHKETLSVALSIHQGSLYVGLMTSGLIVAKALGLLGTWRQVFVAFGTAGFRAS